MPNSQILKQMGIDRRMEFNQMNIYIVYGLGRGHWRVVGGPSLHTIVVFVLYNDNDNLATSTRYFRCY